MHLTRHAVLPLLPLLAATLGCGRRDEASAAQPLASAGAGQIVAEVEGRRISMAELDERVASQLAPLEQQLYEVREEGLRDLIGEALLEKEAKARGLSVDALLAAEVDAKVDDPPPQQVAQVYEANRARFVGVSQPEAVVQIENAIRSQSQALRRRQFRQELIKKASVKTNLPTPRAKVVVPKGAPSLGPAGAKVTVVAYLDYQCPYCHRSQDAIERLMREFDGQLRLVHEDFPLDNHTRAFAAAQAARCAGDQGKFWDYHRSLLTAQGSFDAADLQARASTLGLDKKAFAACLDSGRHDDEIRASLERGRRLGVSSTPTFFVNGRRLIGARPYEDFDEAVRNEGI